MKRLRQHIEFVRVLVQYSRRHPIKYAARIARGIAYDFIPF